MAKACRNIFFRENCLGIYIISVKNRIVVHIQNMKNQNNDWKKINVGNLCTGYTCGKNVSYFGVPKVKS
jgi:hypothetical protein